MLQSLHEASMKLTSLLQELGPVKTFVASIIAAIGTLLASKNGCSRNTTARFCTCFKNRSERLRSICAPDRTQCSFPLHSKTS
ncbi:MAG: hypothetical protein JWO71_1705 [Candidatus Acidoferrum typicum]|nr:hypothetical protein [Candidatus Acidoferrum typicum]